MKKYSKYLLALLGFALPNSCKMMYGCPYADWTISGQVVNEKDEPLEGIQVTDRWNNPLDTTDVKGEFLLKSSGIHEYESDLYFNDVDGEKNGLYRRDSLQNISFTQVKPGDKGWYSGAFEAVDLKVVMKEDKPE